MLWLDRTNVKMDLVNVLTGTWSQNFFLDEP